MIAPIFNSEIADNEIVHNVAIIYKNGVIVKYWFKDFNYRSGASVSWVVAINTISPIYMNVDDISSCHQLRVTTMGNLKKCASVNMEVLNVF